MKRNYFKTLLVFSLFFVSISNYSQILYVNENANGNETGTTWSNAFTDLQSAINTATDGDTIWVAKGQYFPTKSANGNSTNDRDKAFVLKNNVHIYGGFNGTENNFKERDSDSLALHDTNETILDGDLGNVKVYHVVISSGLNAGSLNGFTIKNGKADGQTPLVIDGRNIHRHYGAGIYNDSTNGRFQNLIIKDNYVKSFDSHEGGGGGIYNYKSDISILNTRFYNNTADNCNGGGMLNYDSDSQVETAIFQNNKATGTDEGGGAVDNRHNSNGTFTNVLFKSNSSAYSGGAVYHDNSHPIYTNVSFIDNEAQGYGGGIDADGNSKVTINKSLFSGNHAVKDGGAIFCWKSDISLTETVIKNNKSDRNGGGLYAYNTSDSEITNCIFESNEANNDFGGIGIIKNSKSIITNTLIAHNKAGNNGGGLGAEDNDGTHATIILTNSTIVKNKAVNKGGGGYDQGTTSQVRNSIILENSPEDLDVNPSLVGNVKRLITVGDYTPNPVFVADGNVNPLGTTVSGPFFKDITNDDYRLASTSFAIDTGSSVFFNIGETPDLSNIKKDLQGANRIMGNEIDLGAYEYCSNKDSLEVDLSVEPGIEVIEEDTVVFTLHLKNEGDNPTIKWYKNNQLIVDENDSIYTAVAGKNFIDKDTIYAHISPSNPCVTPNGANSNKKIMNVNELGIDKIDDSEMKVVLYPNPNRGKFELSGDFDANYDIKIYDLNGKQVYTTTLNSSKSPIVVQPPKIDTGVYFLKIESQKKHQVLMFIVK